MAYLAVLDQLRQGTEAVRQALGEDSTTTNKEIEEALWYYYYDIPKTVAFLQSEEYTKCKELLLIGHERSI